MDTNRDYLLHTHLSCTWEQDEIIGMVYPNFVSDYQSKFNSESDVIKLEDHSSEVLSIEIEEKRSSSTSGINLLTEDVCVESDINLQKDKLENTIADNTPSIPTADVRKCQQLKTDESIPHTESRSRYVCEICEKGFYFNCQLNTHLRRHSGEKPYACNHCSFSCFAKDSLTKHLLTHSGEKPFSCSQCSYSGSRKSYLTAHMRTHSGEKPFSCSKCSYSCSQKGSLSKHMHTHSDEKPYSCSECSYSCSQTCHLISHMRTHSGEKPYSCSVCSDSFSQKGSLIRHMRTHNAEKT